MEYEWICPKDGEKLIVNDNNYHDYDENGDIVCKKCNYYFGNILDTNFGPY